MTENAIAWLLDGDISIQYMTHLYLLGSGQDVLQPLQGRISSEGFGSRFLSCRNESGHWGRHYYQPKWTSTHYTLLDLYELYIAQDCPACRGMVLRAFDECMDEDGSVNFAKTKLPPDICINGMVLCYAAYFCADEPRLTRLVDFLLSVRLPDGGYTWDWESQAGDAHTTICVLEGFAEYLKASMAHRRDEVQSAISEGIEFLFRNGLFMADADVRYKKLSYPYRYRYDVLRALDFFAKANILYDDRMAPALQWLKSKRKADGLWYLENMHRGNVHFDMEEVRKPSRFLTLKALNVLRQYER